MLVSLAATAQAAPISGIYSSVDLGGSLLLGRASQSWLAALNANQGLGDVFNSQSWDGSTLGTQWGFSCGVQAGTQTIQDNRVAGTGTVVFTNVFQGGVFYLNPGPWGSGTGTLGPAPTTNIVTVQYVAGTPVAAVANINSSGKFDGSDCRLTFTIANANGLGDTDALPFPAGFPALLDTGCSPTRQFGSWGEVRTITLGINCPVSIEDSPWGGVKSLFR
jgi:hypothetical protein